MDFKSKNSFQSLDKLEISGRTYYFYNLSKAEKNGLKGIKKLPKSLKVLLENLLRFEDNITVNTKQIKGIADWLKTKKSKMEIAYRPARILLQDYTGIPAVADLAAMRDAYAGMSGGNTDDIKKNEKFNLNNVTLRRPETGLHPNYLSKILGKKSKRFLKADQKIKFSDIS